MNLRTQIIVAIIIILAFIYIGYLVKKGRVEIKYTISWYALGTLYLLFDLIPAFLGWVSNVIGFQAPSNFLIFLAIGIIFMILFSQTIIISRHTQNLKTLVQKNALLEKENEELRSKLESAENNK